MYKMLNKIVYKKWTKIPKNEKNDQCACMNIFKRILLFITAISKLEKKKVEKKS